MSLSLLLAASGAAFAADPPLPAGKPAGVKKAQEQANMLVLGVGVAAVAAGIALVASGDDNGPPVTTTAPVTTGTTP